MNRKRLERMFTGEHAQRRAVEDDGGEQNARAVEGVQRFGSKHAIDRM